ncbi:hypothetical protein [Bosea sp. (in: a-proteobacteria)]
MKSSLVIPGPSEARSPEPMNTTCDGDLLRQPLRFFRIGRWSWVPGSPLRGAPE